MLGFYFDEGAMSTTRSAIIPFIMFILNVTGTCFVPIHLVPFVNHFSGDNAALKSFASVSSLLLKMR